MQIALGDFLSIPKLVYNRSMNESRPLPRRRMLKTGTIEFGGGGIDCAVHNLSKNYAALEVVTPLLIPDRFTLFVLNDQFERPCHIIWRNENRIGVAFDKSPRTPVGQRRGRFRVTAARNLDNDDGTDADRVT